MNQLRGLGEALTTVGSTLLERIVGFVPSVVGAVLLLIVGWILARILRVLAARAALLLDTLLTRVSGPPGVERLRMGRAAGVFGAVVFWVVLLFFATAATQVLGLQTFTNWLARLIDYLPTLAAGVLIVVAGYVLSRFVGDLVRVTATRLDTAQRSVLARLTQVAILVGAVLVGADQIGIRVTFLAIFAAAGAAAVVGALAIAVGLGARDHIANIIGAHHLRQAFSVGQTIRVAGHQGRVLEVTAATLILDTDEGRVSLPGRIYGEQPIAVITRRDNDNGS
jgi:small-conductance mechanosensitive channel